jgi:hypothetical protein
MIGKPVYQRRNFVTFQAKTETKSGTIYIVDAYGTYERPDEVSYDIYVEEERCLYKHISESYIIGAK